MSWLYPNLTLQIEPTRRCNLNCKICIRRNLDGSDSSLSLDNFKKILNSGSFRYVGLHGWGEPLLNSQLFQMIEYAESQGVYTNLTTNGTLIGKNIDKVFSSGLREIAFGIYHKELLPTILPQIENLISERKKLGFRIPKIYMDITIYKDNLNEIPDLVELAHELAIDAVILHRLFSVYPVRKPLSIGKNVVKNFQTMVDFKVPPEFSNGVDPAVEYISIEEEKDLFIKVKKLAKKWKLKLYLPTKHSLPCKVVKRSIFVTALGKVTPCCFLPEFYIGNALNEGLREIMLSKKYVNFVKTMSEHPVCSRCRW